MGMGHAAASADVVSADLIKKLLPKEWAALEEAMEKDDCTLDNLGQQNECGDDDTSPNAMAALSMLCEAFASQNEGLTLFLGFHDSDDGDRYDEVDGPYFYLEGVYIHSPAAIKFGIENIERKSFVQFG